MLVCLPPVDIAIFDRYHCRLPERSGPLKITYDEGPYTSWGEFISWDDVEYIYRTHGWEDVEIGDDVEVVVRDPEVLMEDD